MKAACKRDGDEWRLGEEAASCPARLVVLLDWVYDSETA